MPAITLTVGAALPVPPVLVIVPLGPAIALALLTAAVPVAAAALSVAAQARPGGAAAGGRMRTLWSRLRAGWVTLTGTGAAASVAFGLLVFASVLASLAIPRAGVALAQRRAAAGDRGVAVQ